MRGPLHGSSGGRALLLFVRLAVDMHPYSLQKADENREGWFIGSWTRIGSFPRFVVSHSFLIPRDSSFGIPQNALEAEERRRFLLVSCLPRIRGLDPGFKRSG